MNKVWKSSDTYEYTDFNRIESITLAAYEKFKNNMELQDEIEIVTDRTIYSLLGVPEFNRIEKNLEYVDITGTFERRTWEEGAAFSYEDANRWERLADKLQNAIDGIQAIRCGMYKCGTWPMYSVVGATAQGISTIDAVCAAATFGVQACGVNMCGTLPQ